MTAKPQLTPSTVRTVRPKLSNWFLTEEQAPTISGVYPVHMLERLVGQQATYSDISYYRKYDAETGHWSVACATVEAADHEQTSPQINPPLVWCGLAQNPNP